MLFRIILPLLLLGIQYVLYRRADRWLNTKAPHATTLRWTVRVLFIVFNVAFISTHIYTLYVIRGWPSPAPWYVQYGVYPFYLWHGSCFFLGVILLISKVLKTPFSFGLWLAKKLNPTKEKLQRVQASPSFRTFDASRRKFLQRGMYGLTAASFAGTAYGMFLEKNECEITSAEFSFPHLPEQFHGFTLALISDVHSSIFMSKQDMDEYAKLVNALNADMIVVPGDFVTSNYAEVYPFAEAFSVLRAPYGVYGVLGNHEFYSGADAVAKEVDACGIKMLRNDKAVIEKDGGKFYLLGVDDVGLANRAPIRLQEALGDAPDGIPRILLCHRPYYLKTAAEKNIDLMLSGHTHGGQVVVGRFGDVVIAPSRLA
ncbi:MAG: metallophosphoesterase, partial [Bacteroidota bacterium]